MEYFDLIDNSLIKNVDKGASFTTELPKDLKNSLKSIVNISNKQIYGSETLYSQKFTMDIPRKYNDLAQLYMRCRLSNGASLSPADPEPYFATKIFKYFALRTKAGQVVLQKFYPQYLQAKIEATTGSPINSYYEAGMTLDPDFALEDAANGVYPTVFVPIIAFFSQDISTFLPTRKLEQLEMEFIVNDSKEAMGLSVDLTSITVDLFALYYDRNESNVNDSLILTNKQGLPKTLKGSFDIFIEDKITLGADTLSTKLLLRCPHPVFRTNVTIVNSESKKLLVKTFKLVIGGNTQVDLDYRANFQQFGVQRGLIDTGTFSYDHGKRKDDSTNSGLITFSQQMFPTYLEITFNTTSSDETYVVHTFHEYRTNFSVNERGFISLSNDVLDASEGFNQSNSAQAPAYFTA